MTGLTALLVRHHWWNRTLAVDETADGLTVDLAGTGLGGRWVTITLSNRIAADPEGRLSMRLGRAGGNGPGPSLVQVDHGRTGRSGWTGRLPEDVTTLRVTDRRGGVPSTDPHIAVRRRGRLSLVVQALLQDPAAAAQAVVWRIAGKRMRSRGIIERMLNRSIEIAYPAWIRRHGTLSSADRLRMRSDVASWPDPPLISILMPVHDPALPELQAAIRSVQAQIYPNWELCIVDDASTDPAIPHELDRLRSSETRIRTMRRPVNGHISRATNDALALATGRYAAFLDHDDVLSEDALYQVARAVRTDPELVLVYSDEDKIAPNGRRFEPHFKPDFDRELLYGQNYINHLTVVRTDSLRALGGLRPGFEGSQDHDLLLRLTADLDAARIYHIPSVLYHWRAAQGSGTFSDRAPVQAEDARLRALAEIAAPWGGRAVRGPHGFNRLIRPVPDPCPRISIIIPSRDRADLLQMVLDGILTRTDYPAVEIIVVDNDSRETSTRDLLDSYETDPRVRVLAVPGAFNFSDLSNRGAAVATGRILLFLNNDVEIVEAGWLRELAAVALHPDVGAVGAKLIYPDGTLQHGGVILGIGGGVAGHSHHGLAGDAAGYFGRMALTHEASAVTGACLAIRAEVFAEAGGFDAHDLKVAFNDVDLCLRLRKAGYRVVWTPFACLIHHESRSRGEDDTAEKRARFVAEIAVMQERWGAALDADPYYNPNLSKVSGHFRLRG